MTLGRQETVIVSGLKMLKEVSDCAWEEASVVVLHQRFTSKSCSDVTRGLSRREQLYNVTPDDVIGVIVAWAWTPQAG